MAELGLDAVLAGQQAEIGAIESDDQQRIDRRLQRLLIMKNADRFADCGVDHGRLLFWRAAPLRTRRVNDGSNSIPIPAAP
jgi:hypothetical protein